MPTNSSNHDTGVTLLSTPAEAFAGVAFAAIAADQRISVSEVAYLRVIFSRMRLYEGWSDQQFQALFEKLTAMLRAERVEGLLEQSVRSLPEKFYQTVFAVCVDLVLVDGIVNKEEKDFLYNLQKRLHIDTELAMQIIEVIVIKNRC